MLPEANAAEAVMVLLLPTRLMVLVLEPWALMMYPPAGAVCGLDAANVMVTGAVMVAALRAVMASAKVVYVAAKPEPPLVVTCAWLE